MREKIEQTHVLVKWLEQQAIIRRKVIDDENIFHNKSLADLQRVLDNYVDIGLDDWVRKVVLFFVTRKSLLFEAIARNQRPEPLGVCPNFKIGRL